MGVGSRGGDDVVGLSIFSVLPLFVTTPFVYYGASRLVAPHLPMWTLQPNTATRTTASES